MGLRLRLWAHALKSDMLALYFACSDPRTPLAARIVAVCVVAYAFSPIDLIPDFVPLLGYLDDLVLFPLGVALVVRLIPAHVLADCRTRAMMLEARPVSRAGAALIIGIWAALVVVGIAWVWSRW